MLGKKDKFDFSKQVADTSLLYTRFPFCMQKCTYCGLSTLIKNYNSYKEIISTIKKEFSFHKDYLKSREFTAGFMGGGTPSNLKPKDIYSLYESVLKNARFKKGAELTVEVRPRTINKENIRAFVDLGINRLNIGVQSLDPEVLRYCGRQDTLESLEDDLDIARKSGIKKINFDIILGLPKQNLNKFNKTCKQVFTKYKPSTVSISTLMIHNTTPMGKLYLEKPGIFPSHKDISRGFDNFFELARKYNYEITSAWNVSQTKDSYSDYLHENWKGADRYALGPGAIGFVDNTQYVNLSWDCKYQENVETIKDPIMCSMKLSREQLLARKIILNLQTLVLNIDEINKQFNANILALYSKEIKKLENAGFITVTPVTISLTDKGRKYLFYIQSHFYGEDVPKVQVGRAGGPAKDRMRKRKR